MEKLLLDNINAAKEVFSSASSIHKLTIQNPDILQKEVVSLNQGVLDVREACEKLALLSDQASGIWCVLVENVFSRYHHIHDKDMQGKFKKIENQANDYRDGCHNIKKYVRKLDANIDFNQLLQVLEIQKTQQQSKYVMISIEESAKSEMSDSCNQDNNKSKRQRIYSSAKTQIGKFTGFVVSRIWSFVKHAAYNTARWIWHQIWRTDGTLVVRQAQPLTDDEAQIDRSIINKFICHIRAMKKGLNTFLTTLDNMEVLWKQDMNEKIETWRQTYINGVPDEAKMREDRMYVSNIKEKSGNFSMQLCSVCTSHLYDTGELSATPMPPIVLKHFGVTI